VIPAPEPIEVCSSMATIMLASTPSRRKMTSVAGKSSPADALAQIRMAPWLDDGTRSVYLASVTGARGEAFLIVDDGLAAQLGV
jgi:hypothetical protein